ncbi:hypothetical protein [Streptomyces sp. NPDC060194]|uniref:hypothetical protein n=1 Tax=Streptomyces sp. NPDC060194 TaxID=3347069 RepID=UPI00364D5E64
MADSPDTTEPTRERDSLERPAPRILPMIAACGCGSGCGCGCQSGAPCQCGG